MNDTEERVARLEERLAAVEDTLRLAQNLVTQFATGKGRKALAALGIRIPS